MPRVQREGAADVSTSCSLFRAVLVQDMLQTSTPPSPSTRNSPATSPQADDEYGCPLMNEAPRRQGGEGFCACGRRAILARDVGTRPRGHVTSSGSAAAGTSTACRSCLARRAWLDSVSARLLVMACRKVRFSAIIFPFDARLLVHVALVLGAIGRWLVILYTHQTVV